MQHFAFTTKDLVKTEFVSIKLSGIFAILLLQISTQFDRGSLNEPLHSGTSLELYNFLRRDMI